MVAVIAMASSNRPPRGRSGRDLHGLHHSKNNTTTKIGHFFPVALSCKAGHSSFMGDNLKERPQTEHRVCKRKRRQGHPFTELVCFCALLCALLLLPRPGPEKLIYFVKFLVPLCPQNEIFPQIFKIWPVLLNLARWCVGPTIGQTALIDDVQGDSEQQKKRLCHRSGAPVFDSLIFTANCMVASTKGGY